MAGDFFEHGVGGFAEEGEEFDAAAVAFDDRAADDFAWLEAFALHEHIGAERFEEGFGRGFIKKDDVIDEIERSEDRGALFFGENGAGRPFNLANAAIGIDRDDEGIAELAGLLQKFDVAEMDEIEAAVGEDDAFAGGAEGLKF